MFDGDVFDVAVQAELDAAPPGTPTHVAEETLELEVWIEESESWMYLDMDLFLQSFPGSFVLLRRNGVDDMPDFASIRRTLKDATAKANIPKNTVRFPLLEFIVTEPSPPYGPFPPGINVHRTD